MPVVVVKKKKSRTRRSGKGVAPKKNKQVTLLGQALRSLGGLGGGAIGGYLGAPGTGATVGSSLGAALSKWLGSGDYVVNSNTMLKSSSSIPAMHSQGQSILVRHKEFVGTIVGSQAFKVQNVFTLNPGLLATFPWLSRLASCFQEYTIKGAVFHYIPTSGVAVSGTNPAIGSVMMQTSYRSTDDSPLTKTEMLNEYWATEGPPNDTFCHPLECQPAENPFKVQYVRTGAIGTDSPLMYDLGKTFVATMGMPGDGHPVGDLWLSYEIELRKPVVRSSVAPGLVYIQGFSTGTPIGTPTALFADSGYWNGSGEVVIAGGNTINFQSLPLGNYMYTLDLTAATNFTVLNLSGAATCTACTEEHFERNVLSGTTPQLNRALRYGEIRVLETTGVSITFPTFTITPSTGLDYEFRLVSWMPSA